MTKKILLVGTGRTSTFHRRLIEVLVTKCGADVAYHGHPNQMPPKKITHRLMSCDECVPVVGLSGEKKSKGDKKRARSALMKKGWR